METFTYFLGIVLVWFGSDFGIQREHRPRVLSRKGIIRFFLISTGLVLIVSFK
jgi:hypothetical protein